MKPTLAATMIALAFLGALQIAAAAADEDIPIPKGMQKVLIHDPVFNMDAYGVFIPARWHFQGALIQGSTCTPVPFPVFRASSPDGLTVLERLPRLDWVWGTSPIAAKSQSDCLPLKEAMSARDFLKYIAGTLKVDYIGEEPVPAYLVDQANKNLAQGRAVFAPKYAAAGMQQPTETLQMARATVRFQNGSFTMQGLLAATVDCTEAKIQPNPRAPAWITNTCSANVRYVHAPEAQYQAALTLLDPKNTGAFEIPNWSKAWMDNNNRQAQANLNRIREQGQAAMAQSRASAEQFNHSQEVRQRMHQEFLSTMQRGTDMSMNRARQSSNARHTAASDWVDYSLDRQTVRDPNTGQVSKVSSSSSYTWIDSTGKVSYQTNDPNADPNGTLKGTWTRQQQVHGDGSQ